MPIKARDFLNVIIRWRDIIIAIIAIVFIGLHILLRCGLDSSEAVQNIPLYLVLVLGGIPIVFDLLSKTFRFEFSSDLLAGLSIITSIF